MRNKKVVPKILDRRYFEIISVDAQQISNSSERFHKVQHHTTFVSSSLETFYSTVGQIEGLRCNCLNDETF